MTTTHLLAHNGQNVQRHRSRPNLLFPILACFVVLLCRYSASAFDDQHLPLTKAETRKTFPVKYCGELGPKYGASGYELLNSNLPAGPSGTTVRVNRQNDLVLCGKDKLGKPWTATICGESVGLPYLTYTADLDGDGTPDLMLVCGTGGCGLAPSAHIHCFLFDEKGRPVPFTADGYFVCDEHGIRDLLDLNGDGKAGLIYMNYDDGYWITTPYQATNGHWKKIEGKFAGRTYPCYTRFTYRENHTPVTPKPGRHPFTPDLSNSSVSVHGVLAGYRWANVEESEDVRLNVQVPGNRQVTCQPVSWYSTFSVVLDEPNGREIVSLAANEKSVRSLLDRIVAAHSTISISGERRPGVLSPELLWAIAPPKL